MAGNSIVPAADLPAVTITTATLRYLGYDPDNIATHALAALAKRYQLDPLLGEIQLIDTNKGRKVYISRDGMLTIAHRSGQLDGIVVDEERRNSTDDGWTAYVSVYRKDKKYPFRYGAQCKDKEAQAQRGNGPEMALTRAERRALKRAFNVRSDFYPEHPEHGEDDAEPVVAEVVGGGQPVPERQLGQAPAQPTSPTDTPAPIERSNDAEFIVPTREQSDMLRAALANRGLVGRSNDIRTRRHSEFTEILGRPVTSDNELSRADVDRILADYEQADTSNQGTGPDDEEPY